MLDPAAFNVPPHARVIGGLQSDCGKRSPIRAGNRSQTQEIFGFERGCQVELPAMSCLSRGQPGNRARARPEVWFDRDRPARGLCAALRTLKREPFRLEVANHLMSVQTTESLPRE
jgi:hypothetical protein